ncbi:MAG TPA: thiamine pyrophosphate-dependent enzyme, partial [Gaiellaceae bacterium]|nr:thiamine pyrophosphate-dependent enzyme [Gaiellaceae bacterium]
RSKEEEEQWKVERDPLHILRAWIVAEGLADEAALEQTKASVEAEVAAGAEHALAAPFPDPSEVGEHVYAG